MSCPVHSIPIDIYLFLIMSLFVYKGASYEYQSCANIIVKNLTTGISSIFVDENN